MTCWRGWLPASQPATAETFRTRLRVAAAPSLVSPLTNAASMGSHPIRCFLRSLLQSCVIVTGISSGIVHLALSLALFCVVRCRYTKVSLSSFIHPLKPTHALLASVGRRQSKKRGRRTRSSRSSNHVPALPSPPCFKRKSAAPTHACIHTCRQARPRARRVLV